MLVYGKKHVALVLAINFCLEKTDYLRHEKKIFDGVFSIDEHIVSDKMKQYIQHNTTCITLSTIYITYIVSQNMKTVKLKNLNKY